MGKNKALAHHTDPSMMPKAHHKYAKRILEVVVFVVEYLSRVRITCLSRSCTQNEKCQKEAKGNQRPANKAKAVIMLLLLDYAVVAPL